MASSEPDDGRAAERDLLRRAPPARRGPSVDRPSAFASRLAGSMVSTSVLAAPRARPPDPSDAAVVVLPTPPEPTQTRMRFCATRGCSDMSGGSCSISSAHGNKVAPRIPRRIRRGAPSPRHASDAHGRHSDDRRVAPDLPVQSAPRRRDVRRRLGAAVHRALRVREQRSASSSATPSTCSSASCGRPRSGSSSSASKLPLPASSSSAS